MSSPPENNTRNVDPRDPSGFLKLGTSGRPAHADGRELPVVVKIVGTARDDVNDLLGFCTAYNAERQRYTVQMASIDPNAPNATIMALKPSNLVKGSTIETYRAQFQKMRTDPRFRQKLSEYYSYAQQKCHPLLPEHVAGGLILATVLVVYFLGFTKFLMLSSALILVGVIVVEDVLVLRKPWREVVSNVPSRSKAMIEQQFPFLRGKLTEPIAAGLVGLLLAFTVQSVVFTGNGRAASPGAGATNLPPSHRPLSALTVHHRHKLEELYHLGFQDSLEGNERGHSLAKKLGELLEPEDPPRVYDEDLEDLPPIRYSASPLTAPPPPPKSFASRLLNMRTAGSIFYLYRMAMQIGVDVSTGIFSPAQLVANFQHNLPAWQKGMIAFSCYNLFSNLFL